MPLTHVIRKSRLGVRVTCAWRYSNGAVSSPRVWVSVWTGREHRGPQTLCHRVTTQQAKGGRAQSTTIPLIRQLLLHLLLHLLLLGPGSTVDGAVEEGVGEAEPGE